jgi:beta-lactam-binding protein with PASTA domain
VVVPDVRGKTYVEAVAALDKAGFKTTIVSRQPSADVATGSVISQEPTAGSTVARGSQVGVVLSAGAPIVTVPSVTGQEVTSASSAITAAGLTVGKLTDRSSNDIPSGGVISQTPSAGTQVAPGTAVDLVISTGAATAILPDVRGMTQSAATDRLTALGLTVLPTSGFSSTVTSGSVFDQSPVPGSVVPSGTEVTIRVSQGAQPVTVPNVVGATESAATTSIVGVGLVPVSESTSVTVTSQVGIVQDEIPAAGTAVQPGSQVRIIVGRM